MTESKAPLARSLRRGWASLGALTMSLHVGAAMAADDLPAGLQGIDRRWIPSLSLGVDFQAETDSGAADSFVVEGSSGMVVPLRGHAEGDRDFLSSAPDLGLELLSPVFLDVPGRPRLLVHFGWQWGWQAFEDERSTVKEGNPGLIEVPPPPSGTGTTTPAANTIAGQGSIVRARIQNGWYAGIGASFEMPVGGAFMRFKPSLDFYQEQVDLRGAIQNVNCTEIIVGNPGPNSVPRTACVRKPNDTITTQEVKGAGNDVFNHLGPRLAIEYDIHEQDGLRLSLFAEGYAFWTLSSRRTPFSGSSECTYEYDRPPTTCSADFEFEKDSVVGGAGFGVRVSWIGIR